MMQRIDLAPLLRETVATPYSDMVTRSTGAALRDRIEQTIAGASHRTTQLDFTAVGLLDFSCADEVVAKLLLRVATEDEHYVVLSGITDSHLDAIDHVLERHGLSVAALTDGEAAPRVLGVATPDAVTPANRLSCCAEGVAPTRKPVLRSCDVAPALAAAIQTTPPTVKAKAP